MFALFLLFPLINIFYKSLFNEQDDRFTLEYFLKFFNRKYYWEPLVNSFKVALLSPPFIGAYSWILLLGRSGVITKALNRVFGVTLPGIYGFGGIMLVFTLQLYPLIYMCVSGALKSLDNYINEASEVHGDKTCSKNNITPYNTYFACGFAACFHAFIG